MSKKDTHLTQTGAEVQKILDEAQRVYIGSPNAVEHPDEGDICIVPAHNGVAADAFEYRNGEWVSRESIDQAIAKAISAYQKPDTGIPASDLAIGVQASLDKADAAMPGITALPSPIVSSGDSLAKYVSTHLNDTGIYYFVWIGRLSDEDTAANAGPVNVFVFENDSQSTVRLVTFGGGATSVLYTVTHSPSNVYSLKRFATMEDIPTNVSDLVNDAGFITKSVDDLVNYYLKSETYTKGDVNALIDAIQGFSYVVVSELPSASAETMGVIYLLPSADPQTQNVKDEFITVDNGSSAQTRYTWEQIGSTAIDLSDYVTDSDLSAALSAYTTTANLTTLLAGKQDTISDLSTIRSGASAGATAYQKPAGGIPKTDMASGVQTSLDLADSAVQATPVGQVTPEANPYDYATREELTQLGQEVYNKIPFESSVGGINATSGYAQNNPASRLKTDYVDVSGLSSIVYARGVSNSSSPTYLGLAFYDENKTNISGEGVDEIYGASRRGYVIHKVSVPTNAVYARFTYWANPKYGVFFFADGDSDAVAKTLIEASQAISVLITDSKYVKASIGFEPGIYGLGISGGTSFNIIKDDNYGLSRKLRVKKGDTVVWHYGDAPIRTMSICVYDTSGNPLNFYNNTTATQRVIDNFLSSAEVSEFDIRVSLLLSCAADSYLEVNGKRVWTAYDSSYGLGDINNGVSDLKTDVSDLKTDVSDLKTDVSDINGNNALTRLNSSLDGADMTFVRHDFYGIKPGKYRVFIDNPDVPVSNLITSTYTRFQVISYDSANVSTRLVSITCEYLNTPLSPYYDVTVPSDVSFVRIGGRCNSGSTLRFHIEDPATYYSSTALQMGTFNSSFNEADVSAKRREFCELFSGMDKVESFLFFTDPHLSPASRYETMTEEVRDRYISSLQKYYNSLPLDNCICGGDLLNYEDEKVESLDELGYFDGYMRKLFRNFRPCFGNHDFAPYTVNHQLSQVALTLKEVQNLWFREEKSTYYAFDGANTRFYVLNSGASYVKDMSGDTYAPTINNIRWDQVHWFAEKLLADDPASSVVVAHMYSNGTPLTWSEEHSEAFSTGVFPFAKHIREVAIAYNNRTSITKDGQTYDFSAATGRVLFYLCGHAHFDIVDMTMELPVVCSTNLEGGVWNPETEEVAYSLVPTFDNMLVDNTNEVLYAVRVGAGNSRIVNLTRTDVAVGGTSSLVTKLSGAVSWKSDNTDIVTVSSGTVTGVSSGCAGVIATDENGKEEYWLVKVS